MRIETWVSDKGDEEVHHFVEGTNTYLFGVNRDLLGKDIYERVKGLVEERIKEIENDGD
jgi:hypothetical protein